MARRTVQRSFLVSYCPGSVCGSPASMSRADAERYLKEDTDFLNEVKDVCFIGQEVSYPHIGGYCPKCRPLPLEGEKGKYAKRN